jgi:hypothetical protein
MASLTFEMTHEKALLFSLLLGFVIRLLPEILAFPHPIGFDTVYYAARIKIGPIGVLCFLLGCFMGF